MNALTLSRRFFDVGLLCALLGLGACASDQREVEPFSAATSTDDSLAVVETVTTFMDAIENADLEQYLSTLAVEATMFFPFAPRRANDRAEISRVFERVFQRLRQGDGPPYLRLDPVRMQVQMLGEGAAVVTWHFDRGEEIGRRTAALRQEKGQWHIVSFHASSTRKPPSQPDKEE